MLKTSLALGEPLQINNEDDALIWAHIDLQPTLAGRLLTLLTKAPILTLEATLHDGSVRQFRVLPAATAAGFLLSPLVDNRFDFLALQATELRAYLTRKRVERIRILPQPSFIAAYRNPFPVALEKLVLNAAPPHPQGALAALFAKCP